MDRLDMFLIRAFAIGVLLMLAFALVNPASAGRLFDFSWPFGFDMWPWS